METDMEIAHNNLKNLIKIRYTRTKLDIFEEWMGNVALFILSPLIIIMSPLIILVQKLGGSQ